MKILLTGTNGFIGRNLLKELSLIKSLKIFSIVRSTNKINKHNNVNYIKCDLSNFSKVEKIFHEIRPVIFIHLAWEGVANFDRNEIKQWSNISISTNLAALSIKYKIKKFISFGSQAEYGPVNKKIRETQKTKPTTKYGISKFLTLSILQQVLKNTPVNFIWFRIFSCYGPGDNDHWFLNYFIKSLLTGNNPKVSKGEQVWNYIHIDDLTSLILKSIFSKNKNGIFNVGSNQNLKLKLIMEYVKNQICPDKTLDYGSFPYRKDQVMRLVPDISKAKKEFNWTPKIDIFHGLDRLIDYYKKNENN